MGLKRKTKVLSIIALLVLPLLVPWANATFSDFKINSHFDDRDVTLIGSHGRFKVQATYYDGTHAVGTGYYGTFFDTIYLLTVRSDNVVEGNPNNLNAFLRSHQTLMVYKIKKDDDGQYILRRLEEDPRLGMHESKIEVAGFFGPLSSIPTFKPKQAL
ncbi:hypothetical protein AB4391_22300 [Vibrio lentus]|uniref:Uncharacterized protein n=1 Tax=Vibrio lentus TaxID=136468 RepID=A0A2N7JTR0_9VIBR|nr:hypothetical protein [Vibrio lentus]PMM61900.1 hypothetical protein BCT49_19485 [Vibrio lentus]